MEYEYDINKICPPLWDDLSPEYKREYERDVAAQKAREKIVKFDGVNTHIWTKGVHLEPGIYTEQFRGSPANITRCMNNFHKVFKKNYDGNGRIIDTETAQLPNGTCMYLTFELF